MAFVLTFKPGCLPTPGVKLPPLKLLLLPEAQNQGLVIPQPPPRPLSGLGEALPPFLGFEAGPILTPQREAENGQKQESASYS